MTTTNSTVGSKWF